MLPSARTVAIEYDYGHPAQVAECRRVMLQVASMAYGVQVNRWFGVIHWLGMASYSSPHGA